MSKTTRILSRFPSYYRTQDGSKLLAEVVSQLAKPLEEIDTHLHRIQRAHRLKVAERVEDIIRLTSALNLTAYYFEDILTKETVTYDQKLEQMRQRVQRIALVHLIGLATPWAILEAAAIFLNAVIVPQLPGDPLIKHLDPDLFSHEVVVEFPYAPNKKRTRILLHENPLRRERVEPITLWHLDCWSIENKNVESSPTRFVVQGVADRTVMPGIFCSATQEGFLFSGIVPNGSTLTIDAQEGALLDGRRVDQWLIYYRGGSFDYCVLGDTRDPVMSPSLARSTCASSYALPDNASFVVEEADPVEPFDGQLDRMVTAPYQRKKNVPSVPIGNSQWVFTVAEGGYDGDLFDFAVFAFPDEPIGSYEPEFFFFDACVYDYMPSGIAGMAWDGRIPCAFKLLLPPTQGPAQSEGSDENILGRISTLLPRFKAAGIHAYVDMGKDTWILGESLIKKSDDVTGEGVDWGVARIWNAYGDTYIR